MTRDARVRHLRNRGIRNAEHRIELIREGSEPRAEHQPDPRRCGRALGDKGSGESYALKFAVGHRHILARVRPGGPGAVDLSRKSHEKRAVSGRLDDLEASSWVPRPRRSFVDGV